MGSGNDENKVAAYISSRNIQDKVRIQQAWLGMQAGLSEEELDLFCIGDYLPKQQDYIRIALEEGMPAEEVERQLCHQDLPPADIVKRKMNYFLNLDTQPFAVLISQIGNQMKENSRLAEFIMDQQEKSIIDQQKDAAEFRKTMEQEIHRLNEKISQMEPEKQRIQIPDQGAAISQEMQGSPQGFWKKLVKQYRKEKKTQNPKEKKEDIFDLFDLVSNPEFGSDQMQEIVSGFKSGLGLDQIKRYAKPEYSAEKMKELRNCLKLMSEDSNK